MSWAVVRTRVSRLLAVFMALLVVFTVTQVGLDEFLDVIQIPLQSREEANRTITLPALKLERSQPMVAVNRTSTRKPAEPRAIGGRFGSNNPRFHIRSAFRVSDSEIRLTIAKDYRNKRKLRFEFANSTGDVKLECNLPKCYETYSPRCVVSGAIGVIRDLRPDDQADAVRVFAADEADASVEVPVVDVRPKASGEYPHQLGVCVQPVYLHAEWPVVAQFFEHWLGRGATKFFIYRNSFTHQMDAMLEFYRSKTNASIELVDWSDLPAEGTSTDPNDLWYRLEVMLSILDCLLRARHQVKYVAQTDLDEFVVLGREDDDLIALMEELNEKNPRMASASFISRRAKMPVNFENATSSPADLNFRAFGQLSVENYFFPRPAYTKQIFRPERVTRGHIHVLNGAETIPGTTNSTYEMVKVFQSQGYILHVRRVLGTSFKVYTFRNSSLLAPQAERWAEAFGRRAANNSFPSLDWSNAGFELLKTVDKCREEQSKHRQTACMAIAPCSRQLNTSQWIRVPNSWFSLL
ncbi:protein of unknown function DUF23 domain-containing protein [Aphelenchoides fujianensis]|nr:protein of unknown function DUF23 domain-containing protein [Aphelenchoides fujianensis]